MILLGISGKKRSGKDTICKMITEMTPLRVKRIGFADALKQEIAKACGVTTTYIDNNKDNFRLILQGWGTDYRRKLCGDDYWLQCFAKSVIETEGVDLVIAPDVRFMNERECIINSGGELIRVERPMNKMEDSHLSESELDNIKFDHTIVNTDTLEVLRTNVRHLMKQLNIPIK